MKKKLFLIIINVFLVLGLTSCDGSPIDKDQIVGKIFGSWQSLVIQLVATLIMIVLVGVLFMKPVRQNIEKRREYVIKQVTTAEEYNLKAQKNEQDTADKLKSLHAQADDIINDAHKNAQKIRQENLSMMEKEKQDALVALEKQIAQEKQQAQEEVKKEMVNIALMASSKILEREVNSDDNQKMVENFIKEVNKDE